MKRGDEFEFEFADGAKRCRVREGCSGYPKEGLYLGYIVVEQSWAIVVWDGEEDPETFKRSCLEIEESRWVTCAS